MRLRHLALPAAAGLTLLAIPFAPAAVAAPLCDPASNSCTAVFEYTGATQSFTVPAGVTNLLVAIGGASGGDGLEEETGQPQGGQGGALEAIVPVTAGQVLTLVVGGKGGDAAFVDPGDDEDPPVPPAAAGGYGGGGAGTSAIDGPSGGGGGGSFLFAGDTLLVAAGGGGGAGYTGQADDTTNGGDGGASAAGAAAAGANGGGGASTSAGGAAGPGENGTAGSGPASGPSAFGVGGAAAATCAAGGGGGGFFGGGSGGCVTAQPTVAKSDAKPDAKADAKAGAARAAATTDATAAAAAAAVVQIQTAGGGGGGAGFLGEGVSQVAEIGDSASGLDDGIIALGYTTAATTTTLATNVTTLAPGQEATVDATVDGPELTIGDPADDSSAAAKTAAAAFGAKAEAKALAVPTQPAPVGTTVNPGTACGTTACTVTFFVNGEQLVDPIEIDPATGVASIVFTAGSEEGVREITARYDGNLYYLQSTSDPLSITVAGLANTGPANVAPLLVTSTLLVAAGAGLVAFGRRRPQLGSHRAA